MSFQSRRKNTNISPDSLQFLRLLTSLPIHVENLTAQRMLDAVFLLAREQGLSSYNAAYLDLAIQNGLQIATLDQSLQKLQRGKALDYIWRIASKGLPWSLKTKSSGSHRSLLPTGYSRSTIMIQAEMWLSSALFLVVYQSFPVPAGVQ